MAGQHLRCGHTCKQVANPIRVPVKLIPFPSHDIPFDRVPFKYISFSFRVHVATMVAMTQNPKHVGPTCGQQVTNDLNSVYVYLTFQQERRHFSYRQLQPCRRWPAISLDLHSSTKPPPAGVLT